ncbi:MAG: hypothetical protein Q8O99_06845 [bacterium]|nr:hypothetical protein [bacterium]
MAVADEAADEVDEAVVLPLHLHKLVPEIRRRLLDRLLVVIT